MNLVQFNFPHKTASMFAHQILAECSHTCRAPYFSYNNNPPNQHELVKNLRDGLQFSLALLGPVRDNFLDKELFGEIANLNGTIFTVTQIRHPLDLIISQYFSNGWLHPEEYFDDKTKEHKKMIRSGKLLMFEYALREIHGDIKFGGHSIIDKYNFLYDHFVAASGLIKNITVKYEDMVLAYADWCGSLSNHLQVIDQLPQILCRLSTKHQNRMDYSKKYYGNRVFVYVREELLHRHIRSPLPGDHVRFLTERQVDHLMKICSANSALVRIYYSKL